MAEQYVAYRAEWYRLTQAIFVERLATAELRRLIGRVKN